ncbi:putative uncharacterized protein [Coprococcus eutactus CAG:665]|jgi:hypothetical protein|nr:putative uncharacterized protein [Coprococcus eutactus CAG:665]
MLDITNVTRMTPSTTYEDFKTELDTELSKSAEGFVRIGYLLKLARDTEVLAGRYSSVTEFAQAEYGIDKTTVSRWMRINDKFSEGGYSDQLLEQYRGFGYAKLSLMLQIPDAINETLTPAYSKADIQQIKEDVDTEKQVSDIEVMIDEMEHPQTDDHLLAFLKAIDMPDKWDDENYTAIELLAPQGDGYVSARVPGVGKLGMTIMDGKDEVTLTNIRTGEYWKYPSAEVNSTFLEVVKLYKKRSGNTSSAKNEQKKEKSAQKPSKTTQKAVSRVRKTEKKAVAPVQPEKASVEVDAEEIKENDAHVSDKDIMTPPELPGEQTEQNTAAGSEDENRLKTHLSTLIFDLQIAIDRGDWSKVLITLKKMTTPVETLVGKESENGE